jgi:hypothetical protein
MKKLYRKKRKYKSIFYHMKILILNITNPEGKMKALEYHVNSFILQTVIYNTEKQTVEVKNLAIEDVKLPVEDENLAIEDGKLAIGDENLAIDNTKLTLWKMQHSIEKKSGALVLCIQIRTSLKGIL